MTPNECETELLKDLGFSVSYGDDYAYLHRCCGALFPGVTYQRDQCRIRIWFSTPAMDQIHPPSEEAIDMRDQHNAAAMEEARLWDSVISLCS